MNHKKIIGSLIIAVFTAFLVFTLWKQEIILIGILLTIGVIKHLIFPIKKELIVFVVGGILGACLEIVVIYSGAWTYPRYQIFNIPLWLPFLWGLTSIVGITFYESISSFKKS